MKTFKRTFLPEKVEYSGKIYFLNNDKKEYGKPFTEIQLEKLKEEYKKEGRKMVVVEVLSKNLKGKTDLHGKKYKPSIWIFTTNPAK